MIREILPSFCLRIKKAHPRFTKADLREFGLKVDDIPALQVMDDDTEFGDIAQIIDGARYDFQLDSQTLCLRIRKSIRMRGPQGVFHRNTGVMVRVRFG